MNGLLATLFAVFISMAQLLWSADPESGFKTTEETILEHSDPSTHLTRPKDRTTLEYDMESRSLDSNFWATWNGCSSSTTTRLNFTNASIEHVLFVYRFLTGKDVKPNPSLPQFVTLNATNQIPVPIAVKMIEEYLWHTTSDAEKTKP